MSFRFRRRSVPRALAAPTAQPVVLPPNYRLNLALLVADFVFFMVGINFINSQTVLPDFVGRLSGSEVLVGLVGVIFPLGVVLPQLAVAPAAVRAPSKRMWVFKTGLPGRVMMFAICAGILAFGVENPLPVLVILFLCLGIFATSDGITAVAWLDLLGMVFPNERRGRLFGLGRALSSVVVLFVVSNAVRYILAPDTGPAYPNNYALLFFLTGICMLVSISMFLFVREPARSPEIHASSESPRAFFTFLGDVLRRDREYRRYLLARLAFQMALIASPFYIRFATEGLGISSDIAVSRAMVLSTVGSLVAGLVMGRLSERLGSRAVVRIDGTFLIAQPVMALLAGVGTEWVIYLAFVLSGAIIAAHEPGMLNWLIEYADPSRRAIYYSLTSTFNIIAVLSPVVGGVIAERLSYKWLFVVALAISVTAVLLAFRLIEPRHAQGATKAVHADRSVEPTV